MERFKLPTAVHLFLVQREKILLLRRFNTGYEDGNYSVPAGHLDGNEEIISATIREAKEECGIEIAPDDCHIVQVMHRKSNDERIDFFVTANKWSGDIINAEPHKCDELKWVEMDHLPGNVIPYIRRAIENFKAAKWFDSYGWDKVKSEMTYGIKNNLDF